MRFLVILQSISTSKGPKSVSSWQNRDLENNTVLNFISSTLSGNFILLPVSLECNLIGGMSFLSDKIEEELEKKEN